LAGLVANDLFNGWGGPERGTLASKGEAEADTSPKIIVFRSVDKIVTRIGEKTEVWCKPIFKTNADIPEYFIVRTAAIEVILIVPATRLRQRLRLLVFS
jgi:hypothetical protein